MAVLEGFCAILVGLTCQDQGRYPDELQQRKQQRRSDAGERRRQNRFA
jgi:hypothetical protein